MRLQNQPVFIQSLSMRRPGLFLHKEQTEAERSSHHQWEHFPANKVSSYIMNSPVANLIYSLVDPHGPFQTPTLRLIAGPYSGYEPP